MAKSPYFMIVHRWFFGMALVLASGSLYPEEIAEISLDAIHQYATAEFSRAEMMNTTIVLGIHNGTEVVVDYPCIDICPEYTVQVIRYEIPLAECESIGGTVVSALIPWAMGKIVHEFCSPPGTPGQTGK